MSLLDFLRAKNNEVPNYRVIELEAENNKLKDELIIVLRLKVDELERKLEVYNTPIHEPEINPSSNMVAPSHRPRIRTVSELSTVLENRSLNATSLKPLPKKKEEEVLNAK
jgi:uncharacterized protein YehS (DUF1456 family)